MTLSNQLPVPLRIKEPAVGLFWFVDGAIVAVGKSVRFADHYGECLTYDGGHSDHWELWRKAGSSWLKRHKLPLSILVTEYDEHPRGRVIYSSVANQFKIIADARLHNGDNIKEICNHFRLSDAQFSLEHDNHYR